MRARAARIVGAYLTRRTVKRQALTSRAVKRSVRCAADRPAAARSRACGCAFAATALFDDGADLVQRRLEIVVDHDVIEIARVFEIAPRIGQPAQNRFLGIRRARAQAPFQLLARRRQDEDADRILHLRAHLIRRPASRFRAARPCPSPAFSRPDRAQCLSDRRARPRVRRIRRARPSPRIPRARRNGSARHRLRSAAARARYTKPTIPDSARARAARA